ncbi:MAG TPA: response regulator [Opitutaceae bacterium]|nr:response regulator [Opitutaceae bacterium]
MNILVADDDRMSREMLRRIVESDENNRVTLAEDGEEAWNILCEGSQQFDVGLFDINMPRTDGLQLIERIRATPSLRHIQTMLCTAAADRNTVGRASALSVSHYIIKPYSKDLILSKLKAVREEIARQGVENRESLLARLGVDEETYLVLATALLDEVERWLQHARYTSDLARFAKLAERAPGLRGGCVLLGLNALVTRFTEIEFTLASDSAASKGQQSPLLLSQIAPIFEALDQEAKRIRRQLEPAR